MTEVKGIRQVDLSITDVSLYSQQHTGCIVLTHDNRILLQYRPKHWRTFPDSLATFGGRIEDNEIPAQAIMRELNEELDASVPQEELILLGVVSEAITKHAELLHLYFWRDRCNSITGCYEAEAHYYNHVADALAEPKLMDDVRWALLESQEQGLLSSQSE